MSCMESPNNNDDTNPDYSRDFNQTLLPAWFELIPGKLSVQVYKHSIQTVNGLVPCWSYVTDGLWAHGQKELILTLRRSESDELTALSDSEEGASLPNPDGAPPQYGTQGVQASASTQFTPDFHQYIFGIFPEVYRFAAQGQLVYEGDCSWFGPQGFLGNSDWAAFVYIRPQILQGIEVSSPLLAVILITAEEFEVYKKFGLTRILAHLGRASVYYPCPPWSERSRASVVSMKQMQGSLLARMLLIGLRGGGISAYHEARPKTMQKSPEPGRYLQQQIMQWSHNTAQITLRLLPQVSEVLSRQLAQCPPDTVVALQTELDFTANACLVWQAGQINAFAITPPNSDGSRLGGCFIAFAPQQASDKGQILEDGFLIMLTDASWMAIRQAIASGSPIFVPATSDGANFCLEWIPPTWENPLDDMGYGGWESGISAE